MAGELAFGSIPLYRRLVNGELRLMGLLYESRKGRLCCRTEEISTRFESVKVAVQMPGNFAEPSFG